MTKQKKNIFTIVMLLFIVMAFPLVLVGCLENTDYTTITRIELATGANNISYYETDTQFSLKDMEFYVVYKDTHTKLKTPTIDMLSDFDNSVGTHSGYLIYEGHRVNFSYRVLAVVASSISIKRNPVTTYYTSASSFNVGNGVISVRYNNNSTNDIPITSTMLSAFDNSVGSHTCVVTYQSKTTTFSYTVEKVQAVQITAVSGLANKYLKGDSLTVSNATINYVNNDSSTGSTIINNSNISGFSTQSAGQHQLTISYELATYKFDYKVLANQFITVSAKTLSNNQSTDMPYIMVFTREDINNNAITVKTKKNLSSYIYTTQLASSNAKTFTLDDVAYTITCTDDLIKISSSSIEYTLNDIDTAEKCRVFFDDTVACGYYGPNSYAWITDEDYYFFKGEKIRVFAKERSGYVATHLVVGNSSYAISTTNKDVEFYPSSVMSCYAICEEAKHVNIQFQLKVVDYSSDVAGMEFEHNGNYKFVDPTINNSAVVNGTQSVEGEFTFTNNYMNGTDSYDWSIQTDIATQSKLTFRFYLRVRSSSHGGDYTLNLNSSDASTYNQTLELLDYQSRVKYVLEITVTEL